MNLYNIQIIDKLKFVLNAMINLNEHIITYEGKQDFFYFMRTIGS